MKRVNPFDVLVLLLLASALVPIGLPGRALAWTATMVVGTLALRRRWQRRAAELVRATTYSAVPTSNASEKCFTYSS